MERSPIHGDRLGRKGIRHGRSAALGQRQKHEADEARPERESDAFHVARSGFVSACRKIGQGKRDGIVFMEGANDRDGSSLVDPVEERHHL